MEGGGRENRVGMRDRQQTMAVGGVRIVQGVGEGGSGGVEVVMGGGGQRK